MRLVALFDTPKFRATLAGILLASGCTLVADTGTAQEFGVFVVRSVKDPKNNYVWIAACDKLSLKADKQALQCTLERKECEPKNCPFVYKSDDQPPFPLTIGISTTNPTCGWVWDPYRYTYIYSCW